MFRLGAENPWLCSTETDRDVDFCIWVLEKDGLHVPPFEHHSKGDGTLHSAGLDAKSWRSWIEEMIRLKDQHQYDSQKRSVHTVNNVCRELLAKGGLPNDPQAEASRQYLQAHQQEFVQLVMQARQVQPDLFCPKRLVPPEAWSGLSEVGKRLSELWKQYEMVSKKRFAWEKDFQTDNRSDTTNLWQELEPYHTRLDSLIIHCVAYSQERDYPVPPRSIIMTIVNGYLADEDFRSRARLAAEALATLQSL